MKPHRSVQLIRAAVRAVAPRLQVELRAGINARGQESLNTYVWREWRDAGLDIDMGDYLEMSDLSTLPDAVMAPDRLGRIGLDLVVTRRGRDWFTDKTVYIQADGTCFHDPEMTRPLPQKARRDYRQAAIAFWGLPRVEQLEQRVHDTIAALLAHPALSQAGLVVPKTLPSLRYSWSPTRRRSLGSSKGLSFAMQSVMREGERGQFIEYASYAADPVIGSVSPCTELEVCSLTAAHELAHWLHGSAYLPVSMAGDDSPHGATFQALYRLLRRALPDVQAALKSSFA